MWRFTKKKPKPKEPELKPPVAIGDRFKYLGVNMVCCRHWSCPYEFPVVVAEYVTKRGEIKQIVFGPADWASLEAERVR